MTLDPDPVIRRRSAALRQLASELEASAVVGLANPPHALAARLLDRNLEQIHRACDDLRTTAWLLSAESAPASGSSAG